MITPPSSEYQMSSLRTGMGARAAFRQFSGRECSCKLILEFYSSANYFRLKRSEIRHLRGHFLRERRPLRSEYPEYASLNSSAFEGPRKSFVEGDEFLAVQIKTATGQNVCMPYCEVPAAIAS